MQFASPYFLWLLAVIPLMVVYYVWRTRQGGASIQVSTIDGVAEAPRTVRYYLRHLPFALRCAAVALLIVALARPQSVDEGSTSNTEGIDIVLAIDISTSMLAQDLQPDRIQAAKQVAGNFITDRPGDRIGLVAFAGEAFTQSPLTTDQGTLQTLLGRLRSGVVEDGTAIGNGLATAINRLRESNAKSKVIILLTDGENNRGEIAPLTAAEIARDQGIRVYTIGVGTRGTAPLSDGGLLREPDRRAGQGADRRKDTRRDRRSHGRPLLPRHGQRQTTVHLRRNQPARKEQGRNIAIHHLHRGVPPLGSGGSGPAARGISVAYPLVKIPAVMFRFAYPEYLWLLWLLPLLVAVWTAAGQLARRRLSRFGRLETIRPLMPDASTGRRRLKFILYLTAFALLTLALARPQLGSKLREVESRGIEMMLVVDVSNSMLAEDFQPNRLERTKYAIDKLFDGLKQDRVGLVVFAGDAVVQLPITSDYRMAKAFARRISPSMVSVQGTDIGQALSLATMSFSEKGDNPAGRVIVLITDGEGHDSGAIEAAERAAEQGIRIFTIGIGTPEGARSRSAASSSRTTRERWSYRNWANPCSKRSHRRPTEPTSARPTSRSGWTKSYARSTIWKKGDLAALRFEEFNEQFQYLIGAALVLLLLEFLLLDRRNPLLRRFNIFGTDTEK